MPGYHAGRPLRNKGLRYSADPPTVQEIVAVMREAGADRHGARLRALIIVLWRGGLRIQEALTLSERNLDPQRCSLLVRNGKGGRRREIGMDAWGWEQIRPWLAVRVELPTGPMFCVIDGRRAAGRGRVLRCAASFAVSPLEPGYGAGSRRTSYAMSMRSNSLARESLSTSSSASSATSTSARPRSTYRGSIPRRIIAAVSSRRAPMMPASAGLQF